MDVARLNFSHGVARAARRDGAAGPRRRGPRRPPGRAAAGPARPEAADRPARRGHGRAQGRATRSSSSAASEDGAGDARRMTIAWEGLARALDAGRRPVPRRRLGAPARDRRAGRRVRGRGRGRGRRHGRLAPGPQHPRPGRRAAVGARRGLRPPRGRPAHRGRHGGLELRAPPRGRAARPRAHARAADRQDREAAGRRPRRGDRARRRLRDGRARRPRHRAADRGGADRPEEADRHSPAPTRARSSPPRRCSTRWSPRRARRAPRSPTSPTRSSTAPTPSCCRRRARSAPTRSAPWR